MDQSNTPYETLINRPGVVITEHKFKNILGERFSVMETPVGVVIAGDETDWSIGQLFEGFMVTDAAELRGIGEALIAIANGKDARPTDDVVDLRAISEAECAILDGMKPSTVATESFMVVVYTDDAATIEAVVGPFGSDAETAAFAEHYDDGWALHVVASATTAMTPGTYLANRS